MFCDLKDLMFTPKKKQINKGYNRMTPKRYMKINEEATKETGIYIITIGWKKKVDIQRTFKGLLMALLIILNPTF